MPHKGLHSFLAGYNRTASDDDSVIEQTVKHGGDGYSGALPDKEKPRRWNSPHW
jgi:hypothetical protein